ncbi:MAG: DUF515 domain-containing protein [Candidatus Hydrothermarchaeaceae archaeon]
MAEEEKEDIVERLEALRKRVPKEVTAEKPVTEPPSDEKRRRMSRIVGLAVVIFFLLMIFFVGYKLILKPSQEIKEEEAVNFAEAKLQTLNEIKDAFAGLPPEYASEKSKLISQVEGTASMSQLKGIDFASPATDAWRKYSLDRLEEITKVTNLVEMVAGAATYREVDAIKEKINLLSYKELKSADIRELVTEYVPIRLSRGQAAMGVTEPGDTVNIYFKGSEGIKVLAKNARVVAVLRGKTSGTINLAESEKKTDTGGGIEGTGTTSSLSIGSTSASLAGSFQGSTGLKMRESATTYTVNIEELQKAAAASKLPENYIEDVLENYGLKLSKIERETNIGDLDIEYLILFEVSDKEAPELVLRAMSSGDRSNIFVTLSGMSKWMEAVE